MKILSVFFALTATLSVHSQNYGSGVTDIEGNTYETVIINNQEWMAENLRVSLYSDGSPCSLAVDNSTWSAMFQNLNKGAYCLYNNVIQNGLDYGFLYNFFAIDSDGGLNHDPKDICPDGWRIPEKSEWQSLIDFLGGDNLAGGELKEMGTSFWSSPNANATNNSLMSVRPGGVRYANGNFSEINLMARFWTATEYDGVRSWCVSMFHDNPTIYHNYSDISTGASVRCIKDNTTGVITLPIDYLERTLLRIVDLLGRETEVKPNTTLIYVYSDGSTEKVFIVE